LTKEEERQEQEMSDTQHQHGSEVARILSQIREEYESAKLGLSGLAQGTSKHDFITIKMENMGKLHLELEGLIGAMPAIELVADHLSAIPDKTGEADRAGRCPVSCTDPSLS
jgi:hypothetical protein